MWRMSDIFYCLVYFRMETTLHKKCVFVMLRIVAQTAMPQSKIFQGFPLNLSVFVPDYYTC